MSRKVIARILAFIADIKGRASLIVPEAAGSGGPHDLGFAPFVSALNTRAEPGRSCAIVLRQI